MAKMREIYLPNPQAHCSLPCRNAGNEVCIEHCAALRDCSGFEIKPNLKLADLPQFPVNDFVHNMTPNERKVQVAVYTSATVSHLQGEPNEPVIVYRRPRTHNSSSSQVPSAIPIQSILSCLQEAVTPPEVGEVYSSEDVRSSEVASSAD